MFAECMNDFLCLGLDLEYSVIPSNFYTFKDSSEVSVDNSLAS